MKRNEWILKAHFKIVNIAKEKSKKGRVNVNIKDCMLQEFWVSYRYLD